MITLRNTRGEEIEVETLAQGEAVQKEIGKALLELRPFLDHADIVLADDYADRVNAQLSIAKANEEAMKPLRVKDYIERTADAGDAFLSECGLLDQKA